MLGSNILIACTNYPTITELIQHNYNGLIFNHESELCTMVYSIFYSNIRWNNTNDRNNNSVSTSSSVSTCWKDACTYNHCHQILTWIQLQDNASWWNKVCNTVTITPVEYPVQSMIANTKDVIHWSDNWNAYMKPFVEKRLMPL